MTDDQTPVTVDPADEPVIFYVIDAVTGEMVWHRDLRICTTGSIGIDGDITRAELAEFARRDGIPLADPQDRPKIAEEIASGKGKHYRAPLAPAAGPAGPERAAHPSARRQDDEPATAQVLSHPTRRRNPADDPPAPPF